MSRVTSGDELASGNEAVDRAPSSERPDGRMTEDLAASVTTMRVDDAEPLAALSPQVRQRVVAIAADVLGTLTEAELPTSLRRVAKFTPTRRARLASAQIASVLDADVTFRQRTAERAAAQAPTIATAVRAGKVVAGSDPLQRATLAYLLRPDGWSEMVAEATAELVRGHGTRGEQMAAQLDGASRLREQLDAVRHEAHAEIERLRAESSQTRAEAAKLRQRLGAARDQARSAELAATDAMAKSDAAQKRVDTMTQTLNDAVIEERRLRQRLTDTEVVVESLRKGARDSRTVASMRARLLLDTLVEASNGLRRELALPPLSTRPADLVEATVPTVAGTDVVPGQGRDVDDPSLLRALLELPQMHLVVDGYNVTKTGYGDIPLPGQRARLLAGLGALAAQTGAEVTCVFDGAALIAPVALSAPRGVRVRFSPANVTADDVIRELVAAEPRGRPVAVVSSDREVADGVRRAGARPVAALALLRVLDGR